MTGLSNVFLLLPIFRTRNKPSFFLTKKLVLFKIKFAPFICNLLLIASLCDLKCFSKRNCQI